MTLRRGGVQATVAAAEVWCNGNASCHGFSYLTPQHGDDATTTVHFRDETQVFFMDSQVEGLSHPAGTNQYSSRIKKARAPPLSPVTSGVQVWVKNVSSSLADPALALLLVNVGQSEVSYSIAFSDLPSWFTKGRDRSQVLIRDVWNHRDLPHSEAFSSGSFSFGSVAAHDSVFWKLSVD
jgi:hypothetical protein